MFWFNVTHNRTHLRPYGHIYYGQVWYWLVNICRCKSINEVKNGKFCNSRADNSNSSGPITSIIKLIRDLTVIYILTKFGADWLIFVDARVLTRKLWMDGQTVSDQNSSLSTPCSGELKRRNCSLWAISPFFPPVFSEDLHCRHVKTRACLKYSITCTCTSIYHLQLTPITTMLHCTFTCLQYKSFENTWKRRNCSYRAISPFPTVFSIHLRNFLPYSSKLKLLSANSFSLDESKILCLGKG